MTSVDVDTFKKQAKQSAKQRLENRFLEAFRAVKPEGVPMPEREYKFHPVRKWRIDFAFPAIRLGVEISGGSFIRGRHTTGVGQAGDFDKHNAAILMGWSIMQFSTVHMKEPAECAALVVDAIASIGIRQ